MYSRGSAARDDRPEVAVHQVLHLFQMGRVQLKDPGHISRDWMASKGKNKINVRNTKSKRVVSKLIPKTKIDAQSPAKESHAI